jgi:hypothetical protein
MKTGRFRNRRHLTLTAGLSIMAFMLLLSGCESNPTEVEDYNPEPMLTAFLFNGEPVEKVTLERIGSLYGTYNQQDNAISGADVYVIALDNPNQDTLFFDFDDTEKVYKPVNSAAWGVPESRACYRVEAHKPSEDLYLWAETVIPDTFSATTNPEPIDYDPVEGYAILDTMTREDPNIEVLWTDSDPIGGYVLTVTNLEDSFIPLDPDFDPEEDEIPEDSSRVSFDVILPEFNYRELAWLHFWYEGWHEIQLQAADPGYWEYFFSVFRLYMGQVTTINYNVHGGLGIVAGIARYKFRIYVEKVE